MTQQLKLTSKSEGILASLPEVLAFGSTASGTLPDLGAGSRTESTRLLRRAGPCCYATGSETSISEALPERLV